MSEHELLNIGSFAMVSGLSVPTLRHYDEVELLAPAEVDPHTGYRRYHPDQVHRARTIAALRAIDLPVDEVRELLAAEAGDDVRAILVAHRDRLSARSAALSEMVCQVETYIEKGVTVPSITGSRVVELNIGVTDLEESMRFYREGLDVEFGEDRHGEDGSPHHHGCFPGGEFFLFNMRERTGESHEGHITSFGLLVEALEAAHKQAVAAGATEKWPPIDTPGMPRNSGLEDPSGNRIILYQG